MRRHARHASRLIFAALAVAVVMSSACAPADDELGLAEHELTVCADGPTLQGIDVSSWQGSIDWDAVGHSGIDFAIVRIGDGTYHDRYFERNWGEARRVGLIRGAYQFFEPEVDPIVQANLVIDAVGRLGPGDLPVTIDVEAPSPGVSPATYTARIHAWVDRVTEGTGRRPIVYTGRYYWDPYVASSDFRDLPLWHAQYTSSGSIAGIGGRIDRNVFNGDRAALERLAAFEPDADGDGVGASRDCDDHDRRRFPGNAESCDGVDNDCQGGVDEDLHRACGTDVGECARGTESCESGRWGACLGGVEPRAESCDALDTDCDGEVDEAQVCEIEEAAFEATLLGPDSSSDIDGDGDADACARRGERLECLLGSTHGAHEVRLGPPLPSDAGWDARASTLRTADVDGDGRADVCGIEHAHVVCWRSEARGFAEPLLGPAIAATATFFDLVDVTGDGAADVCTRDADGLACVGASGHGWSERLELAALSDAAGFADVVHHGTLRFGDVDGDAREDVCARGAEGLDCWLARDGGFPVRVRGPRWSDAAGFADVARWATLRVIDVTADGLADACIRTASGYRCALSRRVAGSGEIVFDEELVGPAMSDASGWFERHVYTTLRTGDVNADGLTDLCARERDRARCWLGDGTSFDEVVLGPELSAREGWSDVEQARSLRLADVDGDGDADLCGRDASGLRCFLSSHGGLGHTASFDELVLGPAFSDAAGMSGAATGSLRLAGGHPGTSLRALTGTMQCTASPGRARSPALVAMLALTLAALIRRQRRALPSKRPGQSGSWSTLTHPMAAQAPQSSVPPQPSACSPHIGSKASHVSGRQASGQPPSGSMHTHASYTPSAAHVAQPCPPDAQQGMNAPSTHAMRPTNPPPHRQAP